MKVNKSSLLEAVKRSIIMSDQITNRTTLIINENELSVKSANNEFGTDSEEKIPCSFIQSDEFEISYNGRYLLEALQHLDGEDVLFDFNSPLKASILRPSENLENEDMMMLVMPVRNN
jgi:DNA polymerase-3 subunit beta